MDSTFSHGAFAEQIGGISIPLLADFHPKGAVAASLGLFLDQAGITDRATVLVDADGVVRYAASVGPGGVRDIPALVAEAQALDAAWSGQLPEATESAPGLPPDTVLFIKEGCMFSRWARYAHANLKLDVPVVNISQDAEARALVERLGGKVQAPALLADGQLRYESKEIIEFLVQRAARPL